MDLMHINEQSHVALARTNVTMESETLYSNKFTFSENRIRNRSQTVGIFTSRKRSSRKVMFSQASVCPGAGAYLEADLPLDASPWMDAPPSPQKTGGQQAGGAHPTGMYTCRHFKFTIFHGYSVLRQMMTSHERLLMMSHGTLASVDDPRPLYL